MLRGLPKMSTCSQVYTHTGIGHTGMGHTGMGHKGIALLWMTHADELYWIGIKHLGLVNWTKLPKC